MEHLLHLFGGGCGEHMLIPGLMSITVGFGMARNWLRARLFGQPEAK
jgi:hypothetical protein